MLKIGKLYQINAEIYNCHIYKDQSFNYWIGYLNRDLFILLELGNHLDGLRWMKVLNYNTIGWIMLDTCYFKEVQL